MTMIFSLAVGWWVGRNWDFVKKTFNEKVMPKIQNAGKAKKLE